MFCRFFLLHQNILLLGLLRSSCPSGPPRIPIACFSMHSSSFLTVWPIYRRFLILICNIIYVCPVARHNSPTPLQTGNRAVTLIKVGCTKVSSNNTVQAVWHSLRTLDSIWHNHTWLKYSERLPPTRGVPWMRKILIVATDQGEVADLVAQQAVRTSVDDFLPLTVPR